MLCLVYHIHYTMSKTYQSVTTDVVIFTVEDDHLNVLLIKRSNAPFQNFWALPGGFLHENESPEKAAARVLKDKAGITNVYLEQLYTFADSGRDPRGSIITISYFALAPQDKIKINKSDKTQTPTFYPIKKMPKLAFDHKGIIGYALKRLQSKLEYTNVVYSLLPRYFTFNRLQKTYEAILGRKLDKRNFRKKFLQLGLIKPTKKILSGTRQRPAVLYEFTFRKPATLKKFF